MLICPKCGSIAEIYTDGNIVCTSSSCNWSSFKDKNHNNEQEVDRDMQTSHTIMHYIIKFVSKSIEVYEAPSVYALIQKLLAEEGNFSPVVAKCYTAFSDSDTNELVSFYNMFGDYEIDFISEAEKFRDLYKR